MLGTSLGMKQRTRRTCCHEEEIVRHFLQAHCRHCAGYINPGTRQSENQPVSQPFPSEPQIIKVTKYLKVIIIGSRNDETRFLHRNKLYRQPGPEDPYMLAQLLRTVRTLAASAARHTPTWILRVRPPPRFQASTATVTCQTSLKHPTKPPELQASTYGSHRR